MAQFLGLPYYLFCRALFSFYCRLKVKGKENLPPPPYILCSNHCSHMDTPALMLATSLPFSEFGMVAAKDYFFGKKNIHWLSWCMKLLPVDRTPSRKAIAEHIDLCRKFCLEQKKVMILYPEGTRSLTGKLQKFRKGAAQYAYELRIPILPVHIDGTFHSLRKGTKWIRPATITVHIGKPLFVEEGGLPMLRQVTQELEMRILALQNI